MRKEQKQKTSVFSEYENNQNDSITSRQLEFWLKQTAPVRHTRPINQWTLMSTNSIFEEDEHPLLRNQTFQSINKENDMTAFNSARPPMQNNSSVLKSKSYLNAMTDLQAKVKQLEQENDSMKNTLRYMKQDRNRSMSESNFMAQELKNRISSLEPKAKKLEEMLRQNKKLRDWKEQNLKIIKIMDKMMKQNTETISNLQKEVTAFKEAEKGYSKINQSNDIRTEQSLKIMEKLKIQNQRLIEKNRMLEDMKQKSTTAVLEKYSKSVNQIQQLTLQNDSFRRQLNILRSKTQQKFRQIEVQHRKEKDQLINISQRAKQQNIEKKELISTLNNQIIYFRQNYEKTNESLVSCIKSHSKEIEQYKQKLMELKIKMEQQPPQVVYIQPQRQQVYLSKQSIIKSREHQINNKNQIQSQLQFEQFNSIEPDQMQEIPSYETRSAVEKDARRNNYSKSQIKNKPNDILSQQNYHEQNRPSAGKKGMIRKSNIKPKEIKQRSIQKLKERSQQKARSKEKSRQKSRQKSREVDKINEGLSQDHILRSHEPITQRQIPQFLYYTQEPRIDSSNQRNCVPYYWQNKQIGQFASSQRGVQNYCMHNPNTTQFTLEQALLNEINREGIRLLDAQLSYMESDKNQNLTPTEKAQHIGRLKQISEQLRINFEKKMELINKMNGNDQLK